MTRYIDAADHAKIIRKVLKEAFPGVKFSVRTKKYSGGASININWTDGPTQWDVQDLVLPLSGGYFDGMTDYKGFNYHMHDGEEISLGADFIFANRELSDEWIETARKVWDRADGARKCDFWNNARQRWPQDDEAKCFAYNAQIIKALHSKTAASYTMGRSG